MNQNKQTATYDEIKVKESYELRHPNRRVLRLFKNRTAALMFTAAQAGRLIDSSYGFYIVTAETAP